jgi:hypothetical protein
MKYKDYQEDKSGKRNRCWKTIQTGYVMLLVYYRL